ncbi:MAG TPA: hypothetical protein VKP65_07535 [Rhodothermales bacterium]|nr:hypothetical protein [Rhodothermales bacterium]
MVDAPTAVSLKEETTAFISPDEATSKHHGFLLDQQQPIFDATGNPLAIGGGSDQILAQVLVPSESGFLREVELPVACSDGSSLELEIWNHPNLPAQLSTDAGPTFSTSFPSSVIPAPLNGFRTLSLGRGVRVRIGNRWYWCCALRIPVPSSPALSVIPTLPAMPSSTPAPTHRASGILLLSGQVGTTFRL